MYRLVGNQLELDSRKICQYVKMSYFPFLSKITYFQHFFWKKFHRFLRLYFFTKKVVEFLFYHLLLLIKLCGLECLRISSFVCSGVSFLVVAEFINEMHSFW